jgi:hypothetical protein
VGKDAAKLLNSKNWLSAARHRSVWGKKTGGRPWSGNGPKSHKGKTRERKAEKRLICRLNLCIMSLFCKDSLHLTQLPISQKPAGLSPVLGALLDQKNNYLVEEDEIATSLHVIALTAKYLLL